MTTEAKLFRIKPLEWEQQAPTQFCSHESWTVSVCGVQYLVAQNFKGEIWWQSNISGPVFCASPEEGKQLAEAHWNEYIKQALIEVE